MNKPAHKTTSATSTSAAVAVSDEEKKHLAVEEHHSTGQLVTTNNVAAVEHNAWDAYADQGYEETTPNDLARNFVYVLQALSPPVRQRRMMEGNLWITGVDIEIDREIGLNFIPVYSQQRYIEWVPRDSGGGFVAARIPGDPEVVKAISEGSFGKYHTDKGNDLVQTFHLFAIAELLPNVWRPICFPITSTKIKKYNGLRSQLDLLRLPSGRPYPLFAHVCKATTIFEKKSGQEYYNIVFGLAHKSAEESRLKIGSTEFNLARELYQFCHTGSVNLDYSSTIDDSQFAGTDSSEGDSSDVAF